MRKVIVETGTDNFKTQVTTQSHQLIVDEPIEVGGKNTGPSPLEYLETALASCTSITLQMYAQRKAWDLQKVTVSIEYEASLGNKSGIFRKEVKLEGNLTDEQKTRLLAISERCPIEKILTNEITVQTIPVNL